MYERKLSTPKKSFFLLGLRGSGKSFWAKQKLPHAKFFNFLSEKLYQDFLVRPQSFFEQLALLPEKSWVVVDEVQRLPNLLNEIHRGIEERGLHFALLGSSARKLRREGVNLLGGRASMRTLYPLLPSELGSSFSLENVLQFGSLPLIVNAEDKADQLEAYVQLYLREEIQAEAIVRNLSAFARFFPVAALFHGQVLNANSLARDAGVHRATVENYLQVLEDTLLCYRLPAYEAKLRVKERRHPKLYWVDCGVQRAAKRQLATPAPEERGVLFEGFVGMCLRAYQSLKLLDYDDCYYWSPSQSETEVDFLLKRGSRFLAIEVKYSANISPSHYRGLRAIADLKGVERRILVHPGESSWKTEDGIEALGFAQFQLQLDSGKLFPV